MTASGALNAVLDLQHGATDSDWQYNRGPGMLR
jgi:hypothetical protein